MKKIFLFRLFFSVDMLLFREDKSTHPGERNITYGYSNRSRQ